MHTRKLAAEIGDERVYAETTLQQEPLIVALILSFLDHFFLWQSKKIRGPHSASNTPMRNISGSPAWLADVKGILQRVSGAPCRNLVFRSYVAATEVPDMAAVMAYCRDPHVASSKTRRDATVWYYLLQGLSPKRYKPNGKVQVVLCSEKMKSLAALLQEEFNVREVGRLLEH